MHNLSPFALGATLYMPATRGDLLEVVQGRKLPELCSLVICLEDGIAAPEVARGLDNLQRLLQQLQAEGGRSSEGPLLFVRPRDAVMAARLHDWPLLSLIDGFVLPKLTLANLPVWQQAVTDGRWALMPTLETAEVYNPLCMAELAAALQQTLGARILALRIGGNDLMGCLGLRRPVQATLYETPLGYVIPMLCGVMGAAGFALTAPVFEQLASTRLLEAELGRDLDQGLVGKTAIHPSQIAPIQRALRVSVEDLNSARAILNEAAPAVFRFNDAMCEPATHYRWAQKILERAKWQGVRQENPAMVKTSCRIEQTGA